MSKKIALLSTAHIPLDDRIFHHFAKCFVKHGYQTRIICSTQEISKEINGTKIIGIQGDNINQKSKIDWFISILNIEKPDIVICSEPLPILAAYHFKKKNNQKLKIVFDITEWYPAKINLNGYKGIKKYLRALKLILLNFYTSSLCDGFIFGEYFKAKPYKIIFPLKKNTSISYFPSLEYLTHQHFPLLNNSITLCFTGKLTEEKGFFDFLKVAELIKQKRSNLRINLNIIGWFANNEDKLYYDNFCIKNPSISIDFNEYLEFNLFIEKIQKSHIFFDLRKQDYHNQHCLPIKIFYYMAVGRPVIYSDLKAIRKELDITSFGHLVNPNHHHSIANIVLDYVDNLEKYEYECQNARLLAENEYNWSLLEQRLVQFIEDLSHVS